MTKEIKYTHKVNWLGTEVKVIVYENIRPNNDLVFIKTEDGRSSWWDKDKLIKI